MKESSTPRFGIVANLGFFFDSNIFPLAKGFGDCGVFGVSSDKYLPYA
jgi:hypothetical protein